MSEAEEQADFCEQLRVRVLDYKGGGDCPVRSLRVPCCLPDSEEPVTANEGDMELLEPLLRAHAEAVAAQKTILDATKLKRTFEPLLEAVKSMQGWRARRVDLSTDNLDKCLGTEFAEIVELPEDLQLIKDQVQCMTVCASSLTVIPQWLGQLAHLQTLHLCGWSEAQQGGNFRIRELPESIGDLSALKNLAIEWFEELERLPKSVSSLKSLQSLRVEKCDSIQRISEPSGVLWPLQRLSISNCNSLRDLPACSPNYLAVEGSHNLGPSVAGFTALHELYLFRSALTVDVLPIGLRKLSLWHLDNLTELPASFAKITNLTELTLHGCGELQDVPAAIDNLTALRALSLQRCSRDGEAFKTLARCLPALRSLEFLDFDTDREEDVMELGRSLRAWPPPLPCKINSRPGTFDRHRLCKLWRALGLRVGASSWDDTKIVEHFQRQQCKVLAFASGQHRRLGACSAVSWLDEQAVLLIADEVLGGWSLLKEWSVGSTGEGCRNRSPDADR